MTTFKATIAAVILLGIGNATAYGDDIDAIVRDYDAFNRVQDPLRAAERGDAQAARRWPDNSPAMVTARGKALGELDRRLRALPATLPGDGSLNRELLLDRLAMALRGLEFDEERINFISGDGFYTTADYAALNTRIETPEQAEAWLARLDALDAYFSRELDNLRRGVRTRFTQPRMTVERAIADVRAQIAVPVDRAPLLAPLRFLPSAWPEAQRGELAARGLAIFEKSVRPAQRRVLQYLETEYLPRARPSIGVGSLPRGREYYAFVVRRHTTTELTPEQIHALGEREVARIRAAMDRVIAEIGFKGTFAEFLVSVRQDSRFYVDAFNYGARASEVAKRAEFALPRLFGRLPRLPYGVMPMPEGLESSSAGYLAGSPERGAAGRVVYKPWMAQKMPTFGIAAWVLHEGVPGHHLQIALSQEVENLPEFRRADDITAYVEGWGLYSEFLGEEMGIYRDPYEQFGRLSLEIWRACRLVVDTGMHVMGWSRERAVSCLRDNSALAPTEIEFEIDRYIAWPGQALAYKIGEQKLIELRRRAEQQLGSRFDVRRFHDLVLGFGPMPLAVLEARVVRWIAAEP